MKHLIASILFLSFLSINPILADTITVSGDVYGTWSADTVLVVGEVRVPVDSTLVIEPGVQVLFQVYCKFIVDTNATLMAIGNEAQPVLFDQYSYGIHWGGIRFLFSADSSRLEYCYLERGYASGVGIDNDGGGIYCSYSSPTIINCVVDSCQSQTNGGGIYCTNSNPVISNCSISNNRADDTGGGIFCNYSNPSITNCEITNNSAHIAAGLFLYHSDAHVTGNTINDNSADDDYGAIRCYYSDAVITGNTIIGNSASSFGGGVSLRYSIATIEDNTISSNTSSSGGGGISCFNNSDATISRNIISNNSGGSFGGGIYCDLSNPRIFKNVIDGNNASYKGGGIFLQDSDPTIEENIIRDNNSEYCGGIYCDDSHPLIIFNHISGNFTMRHGGGIALYYSDSDATIISNVINGNTSFNNGGGIYCSNGAEPIILSNVISANFAAWDGGGISIRGAGNGPTIEGNIIADNTSNSCGGGVFTLMDSSLVIANCISSNLAGCGGGVYCSGLYCTIKENDIIGNSASLGGGMLLEESISSIISFNNISSNNANCGGGLYLRDFDYNLSNLTISYNVGTHGGGMFSENSSVSNSNSILWGNSSEQIHEEPPGISTLAYSDIEGGWPGMGNINEDPLFVNSNLNDYRLQWGSPCIDTGDPDAQYNDPDSTRAEMGAFYYDQSMPVRILLSPHEIPYLIELEGGMMDYTIQATNIYQSSHDVTVWCDVTLPDSSVYGPVLGPVTVTIEPGQSLERIRTQTVPASAPMGVYHYNAYAVVDQDTSKDSFMFGKLGTVEGGMDGWGNAGDPLFDINGGQAPGLPDRFALYGAYPNPFNPVTVIGFTLPEASLVRLEIFDVTGRLIESPLHGWRNAGVHEVTFDASDLASGIYTYRLEAGQFTAYGKMVLMK